MVPKADTILIVEHELASAEAWAERRGITLVWDPAALELRATLTQPGTGELFFLRGRFNNYREEPPAWTFCGPGWEDTTLKMHFPDRGTSPYGSIFHPQPVICAPFNLLAYSEHRGPHNDWGGPAQWITPKGGAVHATFIGDMLQAVLRDFQHTQGRMR